MKKAAFLFYIVVVIIVGLFYYIETKKFEKITVTSTINGIDAKLGNSNYFNRKLDEAGFWKQENVTDYTKAPLKANTVNSLAIVLTDQPQQWGQTVDNPGLVTPRVYQSYGQKFDEKTGKLVLFLQIDRTTRKQELWERYYSGQLLFAIYDMTHHNIEGQNGNRYKDLEPFMKDFIDNKNISSIIEIE